MSGYESVDYGSVVFDELYKNSTTPGYIDFIVPTAVGEDRNVDDVKTIKVTRMHNKSAAHRTVDASGNHYQTKARWPGSDDEFDVEIILRQPFTMTRALILLSREADEIYARIHEQ